MYEKANRRRLTFRLGTAFALFAAAAVPLAWCGYSLAWIRQRHACLSNRAVMEGNPCILPSVAPGGLWVFGEKGIPELIWDRDSAPAATVAHIRKLFPESVIHEWPPLEPVDWFNWRPFDRGHAIC
jgi:hypothetical protein